MGHVTLMTESCTYTYLQYPQLCDSVYGFLERTQILSTDTSQGTEAYLYEAVNLRKEVPVDHTATHRSTLQHSATLCSTLQHTAAHCNTLQHAEAYICEAVNLTATLCSTLQHSATLCNTLQCSAAHCSALQHAATHRGLNL